MSEIKPLTVSQAQETFQLQVQLDRDYFIGLINKTTGIPKESYSEVDYRRVEGKYLSSGLIEFDNLYGAISSLKDLSRMYTKKRRLPRTAKKICKQYLVKYGYALGLSMFIRFHKLLIGKRGVPTTRVSKYRFEDKWNGQGLTTVTGRLTKGK